MAFECLFSISPSRLLWFCVLVVLMVDGTRSRPRARMSLQTSTPGVEEDTGLFGGFDDPLKPASNGLGFDRVDAGPTCLERSRCPEVPSAVPRAPNDILLRNCHCDDLCQSYDDCCRDHRGHLQAAVETVHLPPEVIGCQPPVIRFKDKGYLNRLVTPGRWSFTIVNRCPSDYNEPFIAAKCESGNDPDSELFYRVPVNGRSSKVLYLNYYCAICNGAREVIFWAGHLDTCAHLDGEDGEGRARRGDAAPKPSMEMVRNNSHCEMTFDFPDGYVPRPCKKVVRRCSDRWTGSPETVRECQDRSRLTSYEYHLPTGPIYRNRNCAVCNYVNETDTTCVDPASYYPEGPGFQVPPYSVLVDLNSQTLVLESNGELQNRTRVELRQCDLGSVYDPFAALCRPVYCRKDYVLTDQGCVPSDADQEPPGSGPKDWTTPRPVPSGQLDCDQTISLNQSEYRIYDNQTLFVHRMNTWYDRDSYVISAAANTSIIICSPFSRQYNVTVYEQVVMFQFDETQGFLSMVGTVVSLASLIVLFSVYMALPVMRNTPGKCVICLIASLFVGQVCYLFVWFRRSPVCFYQAAAMHFGYLAAFFWTNVLAFDICRAFMSTTTTTLTESGSRSKRFVYFSVYAWTAPAAVVAACVALDVTGLDESFRPHYGEIACWISSKTSLLVFFVVPVGVILIVNVVFFVMAVLCICKASLAAESATPGSSHTKGQLLVYIKLSVIMGLTWIFGLLATLTEWIVLWYAFICLNSLQGSFLALVFICTKKVYRQMKVKWSTNSTTISTSSSTEKTNRKLISAVSETPLKKDKSRIISKETCM